MRIVLLMLAASLLAASGEHRQTIPPGSKIFVRGESDLTTYFEAACRVKKVRVAIVKTEADADYVLTAELGKNDEEIRSLFGSQRYQLIEAAFRLTDKSDQTIWAYAVKKTLGKQSICEACAKHLKAIIKP